MNDWPPPSADDAPSVEPTAVAATAWWRHPMAQALLVAWVVGGVIALVAIGFVRAVEPDAAMRPALTPVSTIDTTESAASASTIVVTTTTVAGTTAGPGSQPVTTVPPTTAPLVRSAPPVPPPPDPGAATTTLVVTLPPTTTVAPPVGSGPPEIDVEIDFDADGDDAADPNGEWVRFTNVGTQPVDMTNWIVRDDGLQHAHVFATLTLEPGASVTVYSGCGEPTDGERFFCTGEVWNNDGDVVSLFDDTGVLIVQRRG